VLEIVCSQFSVNWKLNFGLSKISGIIVPQRHHHMPMVMMFLFDEVPQITFLPC